VRVAAAGPGFLVPFTPPFPGGGGQSTGGTVFDYPNVDDPILVHTDATGPSTALWRYSAPLPYGGDLVFFRSRVRGLAGVSVPASLGSPFGRIDASVALVGPFGVLPLGPVAPGTVYPWSVAAAINDEVYGPIDAPIPVPAISGARLEVTYQPVVTVASGVPGSFCVMTLVQRFTPAGFAFYSAVELDTSTLT
jgi:hypothetical protein